MVRDWVFEIRRNRATAEGEHSLKGTLVRRQYSLCFQRILGNLDTQRQVFGITDSKIQSKKPDVTRCFHIPDIPAHRGRGAGRPTRFCIESIPPSLINDHDFLERVIAARLERQFTLDDLPEKCDLLLRADSQGTIQPKLCYVKWLAQLAIT